MMLRGDLSTTSSSSTPPSNIQIQIVNGPPPDPVIGPTAPQGVIDFNNTTITGYIQN